MKTTKYIVFFLVFFLLCGALPGSRVHALEEPEIDASASALIYHNESGTLLFESEGTRGDYLPAGPAVRLMAALVFDDFYMGKDDRTVKVNRRVTGLASSTMNPGLKSGEQISVHDLLCGMLIANSDDAVYALAFDMFEDSPDAPDLLLERMNQKAKALGMTGTLFLDLTGADPENPEQSGSYSCLSDILTLALEVQKSERLTEICGTDEYTVPATDKTGERRLLTRNYMLSAKRLGGYTYKYATGLAAQNSDGAGYCTVATANFGGKHFTCVVMGAREEQYGAFKIAAALFDWANENFSYKKVLEPTRILGEIRVTLSGDSDYVAVAPKESLSAFLPNDTVVETDIELRTQLSFSTLAAPVQEGLIAGKVEVFYGGRLLAAADLVTIGSLSQSNSIYYLSLIRNFMRSTTFIWICAGIVILLTAYVLINARVRYLRQKNPSALCFDENFEEESVENRTVGTGNANGGKNHRIGYGAKTGAVGTVQTEREKPKGGKPAVRASMARKTGGTNETNEEGPWGEKIQDESEKPFRDGRERKTPKIPGDEAETAGKAENAEQRPKNDYVPEGWGESSKKE